MPVKSISPLAIDPTNPSIVYAGVSGKGVYKTTNGGTSWNPSNSGITLVSPTGLIIDPSSPATIYEVGIGANKTTDAGKTWNSIAPSGSTITSLAIDPKTPATLYAGGITSSKSNTYSAVLKSTDGGSSWGSPVLVGVGIGTFGLSSIAVDYSNTSNIYFIGGGAYKSTDGGSTWNTINKGLPAIGASIGTVILDPQNPATLYLLSGSTVYRTTNGGADWSSFYCCLNSLVIDPSNPRVLYGVDASSGGRSVLKSSDGGSTWSTAWTGGDNVGVSSLAISSSNPAVLVAGLSPNPDAFVTQFSATGVILFSTYLGGELADNARGIAANSTGIYVAGDTNSQRFPTANAFQSTKKADMTAFVAKIAPGGSPPGKATLVSPTGTISTSSPTYSWNAVSSASWYLLYVNDSKTQGKINQWYKAADVGCGSGTGTCSATPSTALAGGACQWWIQTWNDYGNGPWSDALSFNVSVAGPPSKATLISPSGNITTSNPTYTWNAVSSATWYLLWVNDSTTQGKINQWYKAADVGCGSGTGTCSATPSTALAGGACQWWIQTWNDYGSGPWSDAMSFAITGGGAPGKATQVSPTGSISTTTPTYTWNAVPSTTWYQLWVNDSSTSTGKIKTWYTAAQAGCASGTGTCSVTPTTALALGSGQWWIQTWNDYGYGPWSDGMSFTVTTSQTLYLYEGDSYDFSTGTKYKYVNGDFYYSALTTKMEMVTNSGRTMSGSGE